MTGDLSLVEAAYLASACLESEKHATARAAGSSRILVEAAIAFDPDKGPISVRAVRAAIEDGVISPGQREPLRIDEAALYYVVSVKLLSDAGELTLTAKAALHKALAEGASTVVLAPHLTFATGGLVKGWRTLVRLYSKRTSKWVVEDPEVMGGLPCIRGTRIPVYTVLGRIEEGESFEDIVKDFDHVPREALEAALAYARAHPRRGRPKRFR